jgi:hypothetical protein
LPQGLRRYRQAVPVTPLATGADGRRGLLRCILQIPTKAATYSNFKAATIPI